MISDPLNLILAATNILCGLVFVGLAVPLMRRRIKMNHVYGIRFKKSFESDQAWYDINEYGGKVLAYSSIPLLILGVASLFIEMEHEMLLVFTVSLAPAIVALVGGWICWRYAQNYSAS